VESEDLLIMKLLIVLLSAAVCFANPIAKDEPTCGNPAIKPDITSSIIGGKAAIKYSWPWQVVLARGNGGSFSLTCGATVISKSWIMSAAHCFRNNPPASTYRIKAGVFEHAKNDEPGEKVLEVSEYILHPKYDYGIDRGEPPTYDIALLKLETPLDFTDHISPVCLPQEQDGLPADNTATFITGWGRTVNSDQAGVSPNLQQVSVPLVSKEKCKAFLFNKDYSKTIICVGVEQGGKTSCQGDSGGPSVFQDAANGNRWTQIGITSFGLGQQGRPCSGKYAGYSKVSAYLDFIKQHVTDL